MIQYVDLRVEIGEKIAGNRFAVSLRCELTGEVQGEFELPFTTFEIGRILGMVDARVGRGGVLRRGSVERQRLVEFGRGLFDALLAPGPLRNCYERARSLAQLSDNRGLRLRLVLRDPLLRALPWEFLHDGEQFLAISNRTPLVRYVELASAQQPRPLVVCPPLRLLVAIATPQDQAPLDARSERLKIEESLGRIEGAIEVHFLESEPDRPLTYQALQRCLNEAFAAGRPFHILHFIGHGHYVSRGKGMGAGYVLLEDDAGRGEPYTGEELGNLLRDHTSVRLVVINACEGARTDGDNPFADVATALVRAGGPAVVAMQFSISDRAAKIFSGEFYFHLALGYPVDASLAEARKTMYAVVPDSVEFGAPVLFMRARDGRIFEVPQEMWARAQVPAPLPEPARSRWRPRVLFLALLAGLLLVASAWALWGGREQPSAVGQSTVSPSPTASLAVSPAATASSTNTLAPTATRTAALDTLTPTPQPPSPAPTDEPTRVATAAAVAPTATAAATATANPTPTPTATATATFVPTPRPTRSPTATATPTPLTLEDLRGWILYLSDRDGGEGVWAIRPDGSALIPMPDRSLYDAALASEPKHPYNDEELVVRDNKNNLEIWLVGKEVEIQLTNNPAADYDPAWAPDGWHIAFVSGRFGNDEIFVMDRNGQADRCLTHDDGFDKHPSWSPENDRLVFWSDRSGQRQLWLIDVDGSNLVNLSSNPFDDWDPVWIK